MTAHMAEATLPILYFERNGEYVNQTFGYTTEIDASCLRDSILPLDGERTLQIALEKYNAEIAETLKIAIPEGMVAIG